MLKMIDALVARVSRWQRAREQAKRHAQWLADGVHI
jgi:hypothetical protein